MHSSNMESSIDLAGIQYHGDVDQWDQITIQFISS